MWHTCTTCHKTYTLKCNLRRHINSAHMQRKFKSEYCTKAFSRKDYLNRHVKTKHSVNNVFSNIMDCISMECTPVIPVFKPDEITPVSPTCDDINDFLNSLASEDTHTTVPVNTAPVTSTDKIKLVHQGSQTDICTLPSMKAPKHIGTNTMPKFMKDKSNQFQPQLIETCTSPHTRMVSDTQITQGWDSPDVGPPTTPNLDIPCYFTSEYQAQTIAMDLPPADSFQGPTFTLEDEDPLPSHLTDTPNGWGLTKMDDSSQHFQLLNILENMFQTVVIS